MKAYHLTRREVQCLQLAANDVDLQETADVLKIGYTTVKTHRRCILQKLECRTMAGALMKAIRLKLVVQ